MACTYCGYLKDKLMEINKAFHFKDAYHTLILELESQNIVV